MVRAKRDQDLRDAVALLQSARKNHLGFMPENEDTRKLMGDRLRLWAVLDTSTDIDDFFVSDICVAPRRYYKAAKENGYLAECLSFALAAVGKRIKDKVRDTHDFNMKQYPKYDSLSILDKEEKLEAEKETKVITSYEVQTISMPVFSHKVTDAKNKTSKNETVKNETVKKGK